MLFHLLSSRCAILPSPAQQFHWSMPRQFPISFCVNINFSFHNRMVSTCLFMRSRSILLLLAVDPFLSIFQRGNITPLHAELPTFVCASSSFQYIPEFRLSLSCTLNYVNVSMLWRCDAVSERVCREPEAVTVANWKEKKRKEKLLRIH